ncbi:hypothetical protein CFK39_11960 [Brachybacterium avium]|uniref:Lipopolysaccharide assembly protein A domain-containing protein n=1 Tax=Brachybacterium avium TaxID=2017485 RepID=A0A220UET6_9MICO|nr:lipopolysaccharide assembly protein LapA domain-containing protein [Brachybacterium avium]ASK66412.1 hypothetical protein CFK39_11960 [Brachybacterium avium]
MTASDDPTRPTGPTGDDDAARPDSPEAPATGRRAPAEPGSGREKHPAPERGPVDEPPAGGGGKTAGMWIGLILGAIILVMLLIFVIQNNVTAGFQYFGTQFDLPLGVAMLLAAIAGALVMALVGSVRMIQMSWTIRKLRKQQEKVHRATR